ncbi:MAG: hypothetical protein ACTSWY_00620 [Promethearchaeota archaeon]
MKEKKYWNKVSLDPRSPYIRRKLERKYSGMLSAESYILQFLQYGIKLRIKKLLML